ncbi:hypothetical protein [Saccharopolyspora rosea]|uniref:Lipoprotein n=1 Tax=Saccharopolyspora rosea TaxID=524884 RepID=A0ABW3FYV0_9PSEU|nr:hypothetical protein [Saccharopolyspora rosea]
MIVERARWPVVVVLVLALWPLAACASDDDRARDDAAVVFCLSAAQRAPLVDSAVSLGLARHGRTPDRLRVGAREYTVPDWRRARGEDFDRACKAIAVASVPGSSGTSTFMSMVNVLLPVLVGAVLTLLTTTWRDEISRGRLLADDLRASAAKFHGAVKDYLAARTAHSTSGKPSARAVDEGRDELGARLRTVCVLRSRWRRPRDLRSVLSGNRLGEPIVEGWTELGDEQRAERARALRDLVSEVDEQVGRVAHALEHPWRPHRDMHRARPLGEDR